MLVVKYYCVIMPYPGMKNQISEKLHDCLTISI